MADPAGDGRTPLPPGVESLGVTAGWWQGVVEWIARDEYEIAASPRGLQAANRAQNLRTYFREDGIAVVPRTKPAAAAPWRFEWRTIAWGRDGARRPIGAGTLHHAGQRVELDHGAGLVEWYENRPEGIEQGFLVAAAPEALGHCAAAARSDEARALLIEGSIPDGLRATLSPDGGDVSFVDGGGTVVLRYGDLHVHDALGRELPAQLGARGNAVQIEIDDRGARYPILVDPLLTTPLWTQYGEVTDDQFGLSVATAGDVNHDGYSDIIVGAPLFDSGSNGTNAGKAYVFHGGPNPDTIADWSSAGISNYMQFGYSVSTAGDVNADTFDDIVVGAPYYSGVGGAAYVFLGGSGGVQPDWAWRSYGDASTEYFGFSVSTAGDVDGDGDSEVLVGDPYYGGGDKGRVFLYSGSPTGLPAQEDWRFDGTLDYQRFGYSVAAAGDVNGDGWNDIAAGSPYYTGGQTAEGRVFVFHGSPTGPGSTPWTWEADQPGAYAGISVAAAGDVDGDGYADLIVGSSGYSNGQTGEGRAVVFRGSGTGLLPSPAWSLEGESPGAKFGSSVATAGDVNQDGYADVIVGGPEYSNGQSTEGVARAYLGGAGGLATTPVWTMEPNAQSARFGTSVATAGDVNGDGFSDVIAGAPGYAGRGSAGVYGGSAAGLTSTDPWTHENNKPGQQFGLAVADAGDVNGDGFGDVIVGSPYYDTATLVDAGRAFVFHGSSVGLPGLSSWDVSGDRANAYMGYAVAGAGDVNGDGYDDVVVGSYGYTNGQTQEGRAQVFLGSAAGLSSTPAWSVESNKRFARFGFSVASAGDVNNDGFTDVLVGAPRFANPELEEGRATLYLGSASGLATTPSWTVEGNQNHAFFGIAVSSAGDVNGDRCSDWVVGADQYEALQGPTNEGAAFVYLGWADSLLTTPAWTATGGQAYAAFGRSVGTCGDVNGDGYSDVIIGAPGFDNGQVDEGRALVYHGSIGGLPTLASWTAETNSSGAAFGTVSRAGAGDVNGDGFSDVIVGAPGQGNGGMAFAYLGSAGGLAKAPHWTGTANQGGAEYGAAVSTAGDVNGDGYADVIVGARRYDNGQTDEGRAYAYMGNERTSTNRGLPLLPRQQGSISGQRISLLGRSDVPNQFRILACGRSPAGRTQVHLEYQWADFPYPLGGPPERGPSYDTGSPGGCVQLNERIWDGTPAMSYHWRLRVASSNPYFPWSRWLTISPSVPSMKQLRTGDPSFETKGDRTGPQPGAAPTGFAIEALHPNPFRSQTGIAFRLPAAGSVRMVVYDVSGRRVATLLDGPLPAGRHVVNWDGRNGSRKRMPAGVYFARLEALGQVQSRSVRLIK